MVDGETASKAATKFSALPWFRQLGLIVAVAATLSLVVLVVMWSAKPEYRPLFDNVSQESASEIMDALTKANIPYKLDQSHGSVLVPASKIHEARIKLAGDGIPQSSDIGFSFFRKQSGLTTSQFMEAARYRHALEAEIARTISQFSNVKAARVHLAIPKRSAFLRKQQKATASVFVDTYSGQTLTTVQIASIVNLVAASIPQLNASDVTVVDKQGRLLTEGSGNAEFATMNRMLSYKEQVEQSYVKKIEDILVPMLGVSNITARVTAEIDTLASKETTEAYDPNKVAVRSESISQEGGSASSVPAQGIPGALSNQPPANPKLSVSSAGDKKADAKKPAKGETAPLANKPQAGPAQSQTTRNYEVSRTIRHSEKQAGELKRLTVAVLVGHKRVKDKKTGGYTNKPLAKDELTKIENLVKSAVGFDEKRGDKVEIIHSPFSQPEPIQPLPEPGIFEQPWFWQLVKQLGAGFLVLIIIFAVLRPMLKSLANQPAEQIYIPQEQKLPPGMTAEQLAMGQNGPQRPQNYEDGMTYVRSMAESDPRRVAQVVKGWVDS